MWSFLISLGVALSLSFDVVDQIVHYRNPKPHMMVYEKGIVVNFCLIYWNDISTLSYDERVNQVRLHLRNGETIGIRLSNAQEPSSQFLMVVEEFAPHLTMVKCIEKNEDRVVA